MKNEAEIAFAFIILKFLVSRSGCMLVLHEFNFSFKIKFVPTIFSAMKAAGSSRRRREAM